VRRGWRRFYIMPMKLGGGWKRFTKAAERVGSGPSAVPVQDNDRGIEWSKGVAGLYICQKLEPLQNLAGLAENQYVLGLVDARDMPKNEGRPNPASILPLRAMASSFPHLEAREHSENWQRLCCPMFREFRMDFTDHIQKKGAAILFSIERPFKYDPCFAPPWCSSTAQELCVRDRQGALVATAIERSGGCHVGEGWSACCCTRTFFVHDSEGARLYTLEASPCATSSGGCNLCAPGCCNSAYEVTVTDPQGKLRASESQWFIWPGWSCDPYADQSNTLIKFGEDDQPHKRLGLLAGMMLVEYAVMEAKRGRGNNAKYSGPRPSRIPPMSKPKSKGKAVNPLDIFRS